MFTPLFSVFLIGMPGLMEWILIGLAVMLLFGASKLPKLGKGLGEGIRNFKKGITGEDEESIKSSDDNNSSKSTSSKD